MNRWHRFFSGVAAGYVTTAANLLYTAASVPLALYFLPKAEFALWAVVVQICGYLVLLDLGISSAVSRFLADHKDSIDGGEYGSLIKTGRLVLGVQATAVLFLALICSWFLPVFLEIPDALSDDFRILLIGNGLIQAVGLSLRAETAPLWAHQRIDITQWVIAASLLVSFGSMAIGFLTGWGVYSYLLGSSLGGLVSWTLGIWVCQRLHLYPRRDAQGSFQKRLFIRMLGFGSDVLLMQLGTLLCSGSQILLVAKILGLESAAIFAIATKPLTMGQQLIGRVLESAAPGLTEIFVRGERERFIRRFYQMFSASLLAATTLAVALMTGNRDFVALWTARSIAWSSTGDTLLALILIVSVAVRCSQGVFGMSADLSRVRWFALVEGAVFISITLIFHNSVSVEGLLLLALASQVLCSLLPSIIQTNKAFPLQSFWIACPLWVFGVITPWFIFVFFGRWQNENHFTQLAYASVSSCVAALILFAGLRKQLRGQVSL